MFNSRKRSFLKPALAGGIVGAGLALMMAPKPGKELRNDLKRFARKSQDEFSEVIDTGKELYQDGKEAFFDAVETGRKTFVEGKQKITALTSKEYRPIVISALASGVVGAGIVWLYTTKKGEEVRGEMKRIAGNTAEYMGTAVDKGKDIYRESKNAVSDAVESGKKKLNYGIEKLRHAA